MRRCTLISSSAAVVVAVAGTTAALSQIAVERNLPPAPAASAAGVAAPDVVAASEDATPIGPGLRAIVLLGIGDAVQDAASVEGIVVRQVSQLDRARVRQALKRFLGKPLSRKLIGEIEAEIARQSRIAGRPFVSLSTPEQEITAGVIQIRVTEFHVGQAAISGVAKPSKAEYLRRRVRVQAGQAVDSTSLNEDLDWLNRNPFRQVGARFAPADETGATDLTVAVQEQRPFRLYGGWSNTGSRTTGYDRFYVGALAALPFLPDAYASYQLTGSSDFWKKGDNFLRSQPRYMAQGGRLYIPTLPRQDIEVTVSDALTNQVANRDFTVRQRTTEATVAYRSALSNLGLSAGAGDLLLGIEAKRQSRRVFFNGLTALQVSGDAWQGLIGWSRGSQGNGHLSSIAFNLHVSPGGISDRSSGSRLELLTGGRVSSDRYAYATLDLVGSVRLPHNFAVTSQFSGQYAGTALPLSAQLGLGGDGLIRGYTPDDGAFDLGFVWRNELRAPPIAVLNRAVRLSDQLAPFVFVDVGSGRDRVLKKTSTLVSAGVGADYRIGSHFSAGVNAARAMRDGLSTQAGNWRAQARVAFYF